MIDVGVHAAIGYQTEKVQATRPRRQPLPCRKGAYLAAVQSATNTPEILLKYAPGAERHVAHLGIAELAVRQADRRSRCLENDVGPGREVAVEMRRARLRPAVVAAGRAHPEAVENEKQDRVHDAPPVGPWFGICRRCLNGSTLWEKSASCHLSRRPGGRMRCAND
nr:hypothetical protein [Acidiferrobacter thiooxydans]